MVLIGLVWLESSAGVNQNITREPRVFDVFSCSQFKSKNQIKPTVDLVRLLQLEW